MKTLLLLLGSLWPVWQWYVTGTLDGSNDSWGLLAAATVVVMATSAATPSQPVKYPLLLPVLFLLLYLISSLLGLFMALRAVFAFLAIAAYLSSWRWGRYVHLPLFALCLLALPLNATLQFYLGYPLRVIAGQLAVFMLQAQGVAVTLDGTLLNWNGQLLSIDVPCSGVKMLWGSLYLSYTLAAWYRISMRQTCLVIIGTLFIVVCGNALRAAALFYTEAGILHLPGWAHSTIGMVVFALVLTCITHMLRIAKDKSLC